MVLILRVFKLIRLPNLVIMALTMITIRYAVLKPILHEYTFPLEISNQLFYLLVLATLLIAAGGYLINDYFDIETDTINKPDKVLVGKVFTPNTVFNSYIIVTALGLLIALFVSIKLELTKHFLVFPITMGVLWFYSSTYKNQFLLGNILISLLVGSVALLPAFYELPLIYKKYSIFFTSNDLYFKSLIKSMYYIVAIFAVFACFTNLIREIIKDSEDVEGDKENGRNTVPVVLGLKTTKYLISVLLVILIAGISFLMLYQRKKWGIIDWYSVAYFLLFLYIPIVISIIYTIIAKSRKHFSRASLFLKIVMVFGILYAWLLAL